MRVPRITCYLSAEAIAVRTAELGAQITKDYEGTDLLFVGILRGAFMFLADLARQVKLSCCYDFMAVTSYGANTKSSGVVRILKDLNEPIEHRHIILVEDIIDTGLTLDYLIRMLRVRHPASIKVCALLDKRECRIREVPTDYIGFTIPDYFVVGYGLDLNQRYRNLPYIGILEAKTHEAE